MLSIFCAPSRYVQGRDATHSLGQEMAKLGLNGPVFIVAGKSAKRHLEKAWQETFKKQKLNMKYSILLVNVLEKKLIERKRQLRISQQGQ